VNQVIVIGGGHNGLAAAFYLAKAGLKPVVLERADAVGGGAITGTLHPEFRCPTLSHNASIRLDVAHEMNLAAHGVEFLDSSVSAFAPSLDDRGLVLYEDVQPTLEIIRRFSHRDAERYAGFRASMNQVSSVLASLWNAIPPDIDRPSSADIWHLLKTARRFRALGRQDAFRLLRWLSMSAADFLEEWFETDLLRATLAATGVSGGMLGPRSAGSALVSLLRETSNHLNGNARQVRGGPSALTEAMASAARAVGADIRTASTVERILVSNNRVTGVVVAGTEIPATAVVSGIDPKATFMNLLDPADLSPDVVGKIRNYRARGTLAKVNLALSALPSFRGARNDPQVLTGRIHIGQDIDYLERAFDCAKYGQVSDAPWLEISIPSILDSTLAPPGGHVMSIYAHYAPFHLQGSTWEKERDTLLVRVMNALDLFAPQISDLVVARQVITPMDMERTYGYSSGHVFHGELALDQLFAMRPLLGYARYTTPVDGLFLCGAGTHPGGLMSGASGKWAALRVVRSLPSLTSRGV
jgi:phytoene dehydrogenase-like protein